jgi:hypothetical protein
MILPSVGGKHKGKFLGAYLPEWMIVYLSLYSLAKSISKTAILKEIIESWITAQQQIDSEEELTQALIERINANWKVTKIITPELTYKKFCEAIQQELLDKGLQITQVKNVINKLQY